MIGEDQTETEEVEKSGRGFQYMTEDKVRKQDEI